jgi:Lrp/AsnC family transcriptional regulator for asnA, asnC and gidA
MSNLDTPQLAYIGIHAEQNSIKKVAERIAKLPEINGVIILLGRFDILAIGLFEGLSEVHQVASNKILDFEGVRLVETSVVVDVIKYDNRVAKIVTPQSEKL